MELAFAGFLFGAVVVSVPIILHFMKRKPQEIQLYSAFRFLHKTVTLKNRRNNIRKWIILACRCLAFMCIVLAFSWPYLPDFAGNPESTTVLVWDNSFSMAAAPYADELRNKALGIIRSANAQNPILIGLASKKLKWAGSFSGDPEKLRTWFSSMPPGEGSSQFGYTLKQADTRLNTMPGKRKRIILITDKHAVPWKNVLLNKPLSPGIELTIVTPDHGGFNNVAILSVNPSPSYADKTPYLNLEIKLRNYTTGNVADTLLTYLGQEEIAHRKISIEKDSSFVWKERIPVRGFEAPLEGRVHFKAADDLSMDNTRYFSINPPDLPNVCITPTAAAETDFIKLAFEPAKEMKVADLIDIDNRTQPATLENAVAAIVRDTITIKSEGGKSLDAFVRNGGVLVMLYSGGQRQDDFLASFDIKKPAKQEKGTRRLSSLDFGHPLFAAFLKDKVGDFFDVLFFDPPTLKFSDQARIIAKYDDGTPAISEQPVGNGKVIVIATGFSRKHTNWPTHTSFLPFWRELLAYCDKRSAQSEVTIDSMPMRIDKLQKVLAMPPCGAKHSSTGILLRADTAGNYLVQTADKQRMVSVNVPAFESDPATLPDYYSWKSLISTNTHLDRNIITQVAERDQARSFWQILLVTGILLGICELALANRTAI